MSIDTIDETFSALTGGLGLGLMCDTHVEEEGKEHRAWWFFHLECTACAWDTTLAACEATYYEVVSKKNEAGMGCGGCGKAYKPFDLIQTTRRVNA